MESFLAERHARYHTPEREVFALARRAAGREPLGREQIAHGFDNEVYAVALEDGAQLIIRIRRHGGVSYADEAWAIEQSRAAGAPVPEILLLDTVPAEDGPREAMVQRCLPGRPLAAREADLGPDELAHVLRQLGVALAALHSVPAGGFYQRHAGTWDFPSYDAVWDSHISERKAEAPLLLEHGFSEADVAEMLAMMEQAREQLRWEQPVLCHGDLSPEHVFVDDNLALSGLIDFGEFQGGSPLGDIAYFHDARPQFDLTLLQAGYGDRWPFGPALEERLLLNNIGVQIGYLAHFIRSNIAPEIAPGIAALRRTLNAWRARPR
jgi:aminoglycoside phosphotransferase (APT) family kinase protein